MCNELEEYFSKNTHTSYVVEEITEEEIQDARKLSRSYLFGTIEGTRSFQVVVFKPNDTVFRAAQRICFCNSDNINTNASCNHYSEFELKANQLKVPSSRSMNTPIETQHESTTEVEDTRIEFVQPDTVCAIAPSEKSRDPVWFVKIVKVVNFIYEQFQ